MTDINVSSSHTWSSQTKGTFLNNIFDLKGPFSTNLSQGTNTSERDNIAWAFQHFLTRVWYFQTETSSCINEVDDLLQQQINITNMSRFHLEQMNYIIKRGLSTSLKSSQIIL